MVEAASRDEQSKSPISSNSKIIKLPDSDETKILENEYWKDGNLKGE